MKAVIIGLTRTGRPIQEIFFIATITLICFLIYNAPYPLHRRYHVK